MSGMSGMSGGHFGHFNAFYCPIHVRLCPKCPVHCPVYCPVYCPVLSGNACPIVSGMSGTRSGKLSELSDHGSERRAPRVSFLRLELLPRVVELSAPKTNPLLFSTHTVTRAVPGGQSTRTTRLCDIRAIGVPRVESGETSAVCMYLPPQR